MNKIKAHLTNIAFSHSIFALPFAYMGLILAVKGFPDWLSLLWVTVAMVGARSAALAINNLVDLKFDRIHPRFKKRPMVCGAIGRLEAIFFIIGSFALFLVAVAQLHPICRLLWPVVVLPFVIYPYTKRFTWACHLVLGLSLAVAPISAYIAMTGSITWPILLLGLAVALWIGAFDMIYGCQDVEFDRSHGLHSAPVRFGVLGALQIASSLHVVSIICFFIVGIVLQLGMLYYLGVVFAAIVLLYQHKLVWNEGMHCVTQAYFMRNGLVSVLVFLFTLFSL